MTKFINQNPSRNCLRQRTRTGAVFSTELILVLPLVVILVVALVEFAFLWSAAHKVHLATQHACRVGTRPSFDIGRLDQAVRSAADAALVDQRLIESHRLLFRPGAHTGDSVVVEIKVPMGAASPDMLSLVGFSLKNRFLTSRIVMSKE